MWLWHSQREENTLFLSITWTSEDIVTSNVLPFLYLLQCCSRHSKYSIYSFYLCAVILEVYTAHIALPTLPTLWLHTAIRKTFIIWELCTSLNTIPNWTLCHGVIKKKKKKGFKIFFFSTWQTGWKMQI